ncbi:MAG: tRNA 2-thiouridine(34) synthase MnmA [Angustibacter sp.]
MRVLAAMSGGVDSAVAAARVVEAGHDVVGVHLALSREPAADRVGARGCCTVADAQDARRSADILGIPFYVWDMSEQFNSAVIDDFVAEYEAGRTPNPCLRCNEKVKFSALLDKAIALGFDALCTGHYARIDVGAGEVSLHRAADPAKDQSYVLGVLTQSQLRRAIFPLGDVVKSDVRLEAQARGLAVADKPDSHDICFISDGDTQGWLTGRLGVQPGKIVDTTGTELGEHEGTHSFTIGQRRGLRLGRPAADGKPRYVLDIQPVNNTVVVGAAADLAVHQLTAVRPRWCGAAPEGPLGARAQVRAHGSTVPAQARVHGDELHIVLGEPFHGVAPGQAVVLYQGTRVVGSATISRTSSAPASTA